MSTQDLGQYNAAVKQNGLRLNANEPLVAAGATTLSGTVVANTPIVTHIPVAINATATATAAQVASGYITSTSGAATTITLPTSTAIAAAIGATAGTVFDLYIDNTAGSNTVTITPDSSQVKSQVAQVATYGVPTFGLFTVASGTTGLARFTFVFSSATAASIARTF